MGITERFISGSQALNIYERDGIETVLMKAILHEKDLINQCMCYSADQCSLCDTEKKFVCIKSVMVPNGVRYVRCWGYKFSSIEIVLLKRINPNINNFVG